MTAGTFEGPRTVRLETGHTVTEVEEDSTYVGHTFLTGFVSGVLYVSRDGTNWFPSDVRFATS